jgi:hypothetical protein
MKRMKRSTWNPLQFKAEALSFEHFIQLHNSTPASIFFGSVSRCAAYVEDQRCKTTDARVNMRESSMGAYKLSSCVQTRARAMDFELNRST